MNMEDESHHIVGTRDMADYLRTSRSTVRRWIREKGLPVWFEARKYRSTKPRLDMWLYEQIEMQRKERASSDPQ